MSQQVQELIEKIKSEGIEQAQLKAQEIERQAQKKAGEIVQQAHKDAEAILAKAKEGARKEEQAVQAALKQSARDTLLSLRKDIEGLLKKVAGQDVAAALSPGAVAEIVAAVIKGSAGQGTVTVNVAEKDLKRLKDHFLSRLKDQIKQPVTFQSSGDIGSGFTISFDKGKSYFDFSDAALVEYLSGLVKPEISQLLKDSVSR